MVVREGLFHRHITCPVNIAVLSCIDSWLVCFVVIRCCGDLEDVPVTRSAYLVAKAGFALHC